MQINKNKTEVENIIAQLNDDLTRLGLTIRAPETGVAISELTNIPDSEDTGNDELLIRNSSVKIKFSAGEKEHETIFKYRRLSLDHILAKKALSNETGYQGTALTHQGTTPKSNTQEVKDTYSTLLDVSLEKDHVLEKNTYDPAKGVTGYTLRAAINSFLYTGQAAMSFLTRANDTGEYNESGNVHYFTMSSSLTGINTPQVYLPVNVTSIPDNFLTNSTVTTLKLKEGITQIGDQSFANSFTSLSGVLPLPESLTSIGENAFQGAVTDTFMVPDHLTSIKAGAFGTVTTLTANTLAAIARVGKVKAGGENSKYVLTLTDTTGKADSEHDTHGQFTYHNNSPIYFTKEMVVQNTELFKDKDFTKDIKSLVLPKSVTEINDTFYGLTDIEELSLQHVTSLGPNAFKDSTITTVKLYPTLTEIDTTAFEGATIVSFEVENADHRDTVKQKLPNFASVDFTLRQNEEPGPVESEVPDTVESEGFTYGS